MQKLVDISPQVGYNVSRMVADQHPQASPESAEERDVGAHQIDAEDCDSERLVGRSR